MEESNWKKDTKTFMASLKDSFNKIKEEKSDLEQKLKFKHTINPPTHDYIVVMQQSSLENILLTKMQMARPSPRPFCKWL